MRAGVGASPARAAGGHSVHPGRPGDAAVPDSVGSAARGRVGAYVLTGTRDRVGAHVIAVARGHLVAAGATPATTSSSPSWSTTPRQRGPSITRAGSAAAGDGLDGLRHGRARGHGGPAPGLPTDAARMAGADGHDLFARHVGGMNSRT
ncbi:hypothetical protein SGLAM104S_06974 [Streptomyces glaucescens]